MSHLLLDVLDDVVQHVVLERQNLVDIAPVLELAVGHQLQDLGDLGQVGHQQRLLLQDDGDANGMRVHLKPTKHSVC